MVSRIFKKGKEQMKTEQDAKVLDWVKEMTDIITQNMYRPAPAYEDCLFFPSKPNLQKVCGY